MLGGPCCCQNLDPDSYCAACSSPLAQQLTITVSELESSPELSCCVQNFNRSYALCKSRADVSKKQCELFYSQYSSGLIPDDPVLQKSCPWPCARVFSRCSWAAAMIGFNVPPIDLGGVGGEGFLFYAQEYQTQRELILQGLYEKQGNAYVPAGFEEGCTGVVFDGYARVCVGVGGRGIVYLKQNFGDDGKYLPPLSPPQSVSEMIYYWPRYGQDGNGEPVNIPPFDSSSIATSKYARIVIEASAPCEQAEVPTPYSVTGVGWDASPRPTRTVEATVTLIARSEFPLSINSGQLIALGYLPWDFTPAQFQDAARRYQDDSYPPIGTSQVCSATMNYYTCSSHRKACVTNVNGYVNPGAVEFEPCGFVGDYVGRCDCSYSRSAVSMYVETPSSPSQLRAAYQRWLEVSASFPFGSGGGRIYVSRWADLNRGGGLWVQSLDWPVEAPTSELNGTPYSLSFAHAFAVDFTL